MVPHDAGISLNIEVTKIILSNVLYLLVPNRNQE